MRPTVRLGAGVVLAAAALAGALALGDGISAAHPTVLSGRDPAHRVTPAPRAHVAAAAAAGVEHPLPRLAGSRAVAAPVQQLAFSTAGAPQVLSSFAGLNLLDGHADPPDPDVAAGDGFVVEVVNDAIRVFGTDGSVRVTYDPTTFFQSSSGDLTDPSIVFDAATGRWFSSILDAGDGTVRLAVSQTADPTGSWTVYDHAPGACADQPTLGVSQTLVAVGYGGFTLPCRSPSASYEGGGQFVYSKADLLAGVTAHFTNWGPNPAFAPVSAVPGGSDPPTALTLTSASDLEVLGYAGVPTDTSSVTETDTTVSIADLTTPPPATQKNGTAPIDTGDLRVRSGYADPASGTVWATANVACEPPGDTTVRSCLRILAVRAGKAVYDRDLGSSGNNLFYGRIAVDGNGNAVVVHGFSSSTAFPSVGVFAVATNGGLTPSAPIALGNEAHNDPRFGDYFGAAPDGSGGVWVVGEVGAFVTGSSFDWRTMVAHVAAVPTPPPPPPPAHDTTRPRARAIASHGRRGFTALLRYQASDNSGKTREQITVFSRGKVVKRISIGTKPTSAGRSYRVAWHVPTKTLTPLKFCIVAFDPSGNASATSCARIGI